MLCRTRLYYTKLYVDLHQNTRGRQPSQVIPKPEKTIYISADNHAPIIDISTHPSETHILYLYWMLGIRNQLRATYLIILCFLCDGTLHPRYAHLCCLLYISLHAALSVTCMRIM